MKVYIIIVTPEAEFSKVSQEGYTSLEKAQAWIESRSDKPTPVNQLKYKTDDYTIYDIREITIV